MHKLTTPSFSKGSPLSWRQAQFRNREGELHGLWPKNVALNTSCTTNFNWKHRRVNITLRHLLNSTLSSSYQPGKKQPDFYDSVGSQKEAMQMDINFWITVLVATKEKLIQTENLLNFLVSFTTKISINQVTKSPSQSYPCSCFASDPIHFNFWLVHGGDHSFSLRLNKLSCMKDGFLTKNWHHFDENGISVVLHYLFYLCITPVE